MYSCNVCKENGEEFLLPVDEIGAALMQAHLKNEHPERL